MTENAIQIKYFDFSIKLVKFIYSKEDFIHKLSFVQKEIRETKYRLRLLMKIQIWTSIDRQDLLSDVEEISRIVTKILTTTKSNLNAQKVIENQEF